MTSYQLIFIVMMGIGFALLLLSALFGEIGDLIGHADLDTGADTDGPSWISMSVISVALISFGAIGLLAVRYGSDGPLAVVIGVVAGVLGAAAVRRFVLRPLMRQQYNALVSESSYMGTLATVTLRIDPQGFGEVRLQDSSHAIVRKRAQTTGTESLGVGQSVVVTAVAPDHVVVNLPSSDDKN